MICKPCSKYNHIYRYAKQRLRQYTSRRIHLMAVLTGVEPEFISVQGAETMTGRSRWSWRRDAYSGKIASVKIGAKLLIPIAEIRRVIAENTRPRLQDAR
jgi:hypothetical protein